VIRFLRTAIEREDRNRDRLRQMRQDHKEAEAGIARLLELVEKELMDAEDASMRERLVNLRFRRDELHHRPPDLRQADARLLLNEVRVNDREIRISGSKAVLVRRTAGGLAKTTPTVLSFVREWRTQEDSNLWPLPSELELQCYAKLFDPTLEHANLLFIQRFLENEGIPDYAKTPHSFRSAGEFLVSFLDPL